MFYVSRLFVKAKKYIFFQYKQYFENSFYLKLKKTVESEIWNRKSSQKVVTREGRNVKNSQIFENFSRTGGNLDKVWIFNENLKIAIAVTRRGKILRRFRSDPASQIKFIFHMTDVFFAAWNRWSTTWSTTSHEIADRWLGLFLLGKNHIFKSWKIIVKCYVNSALKS